MEGDLQPDECWLINVFTALLGGSASICCASTVPGISTRFSSCPRLRDYCFLLFRWDEQGNVRRWMQSSVAHVALVEMITRSDTFMFWPYPAEQPCCGRSAPTELTSRVHLRFGIWCDYLKEDNLCGLESSLSTSNHL